MDNQDKNFKELVLEQNYELQTTNCKRDEIHDKLKPLNRYIKNLAKLKKDELVKIINKLAVYSNETNKYNFGSYEVVLDKEQQGVVDADPNTHLRIIAAAGSGKTTVILCKIKHLLDNFTTPNKILIMTFNVDACNNLKNRLNKLFGFDINVSIKTIDSFCAGIFYKYNYLMSENHDKKNNFISISEVGMFAEKILNKFAPIICAEYKYIFFDEFQDISDTQFKILKYFSDNSSYLTVIGDDNQNIYQWRGSDNSFIINFDKILNNTKTHSIVTNYRSIKSIVDLANNSIENNKNKVDKEMKANNNTIIKPKLIIYDAQILYFNEILTKIKEIKDRTDCSYDQFAIISRSTYALKLFEEHLSKTAPDIPFIALITEKESNDNKVMLVPDHIALTTIHRSKGLEWQTVFIIGLCDKFFPCLMNNNIINLEEERRLFYVAVTRAKKYLYFLCCAADLPLSRFISEIYDSDIELIGKTSKPYSKKDLFSTDNDSKIKDSYSVTDIVGLLKATDFQFLRDNNLIPDLKPVVTKLYENELVMNDDIKKHVFESDFGDFCDRHITRKIMLLSRKKEDITDSDALMIIETIALDKEEAELCNKYNMKTLLFKYDYNKDKILKHLAQNTKGLDMMTLGRIVKKLPNNKASNLERVNTYPAKFIKILKQSYTEFCDPKLDNSKIMKSIYYISLCRKFNNDRRRLIYRDIYDMFMKDYDEIDKRINLYAESIKDNDNACKINVHKYYQIGTHTIRFAGEIDMIDKTNLSLIDFKCSGSDYKLEWLIQLLLYYALIKETKGDSYTVNKLQIFNILKGETYDMEIDPKYDFVALLDYIRVIITRDIFNLRNKDKSGLHINLLLDTKKDEINIKPILKEKIYVDIIENNDAVNYMFIDTETTGINTYTDDIIQIAYIIYDDKFKLLKKVDKLVIPEKCLIPKNAFDVHKITHKKILKANNRFADVFTEFIKDVNDVKHIIGHNVAFDINMIKNNLERYDFIQTNPFETKTITCTAKLGKDICDVKNINGSIKTPKLGELYFKLFGRKIENAHDAMVDTISCAECYFKLCNIDLMQSKLDFYKEEFAAMKARIKKLYERMNIANKMYK
jgi:DNA polymerase III epsilon subunit-like protein